MFEIHVKAKVLLTQKLKLIKWILLNGKFEI